MTMVELRHKICELGAARAEHPYGTPEFNAANEALRTFTRDQILHGENPEFVFGEFCEEVIAMKNFQDADPDNQDLAAEMAYYQETVSWLRENHLDRYADELQGCINGEI